MSRGRRSNAASRCGAPDDAAISDLLDNVREVRRTLSLDLSAAAGALDADRPEVARDIIAASAAELRSIGDQLHAGATEPSRREQSVRKPGRRTRVLLAVPMIPLVGVASITAAAALGGHHTSTPSPRTAVHAPVLTPTQVTTPAVSRHLAANSALHRLEHVVAQHPHASQVIAVADDLHDQLTRLIATSTHDPAQLQVVQHLLALEQRVLESSKVPGRALALAASREIAELLQMHPMSAHTQQPVSPRTSPSLRSSTTRATPTATPTPTHSQPVKRTHPQPTTTHSTPSPKPSYGLFGNGIFSHA